MSRRVEAEEAEEPAGPTADAETGDGAATSDDGEPTSDDGAPTSDEPTSDDGAPTPDDGEPTSDDGEPTSDAGEPTSDAGEPTSDDGEPTSDDGGEPTAKSEASPAPGASEPVIELVDLRVAVGERVLLEGVNLRVERGERVLLVGPSGSGKSVLLRLLTGLLPADGPFEVSGTAKIHGRSVLPGDAEVRRAREEVGIVFQDHALLDELSAADNLAFARDHSPSPAAADACQRALEFLREHGIEPKARVGTLSGGQKQRVAIARALARDPALVCLDEPTSALDPRAARAVAGLIDEASQTFGKTTLVVTHDYPPFEGKVDRVVFLDPASAALREPEFGELEATMLATEIPALPEPEQAPSLVARAAGAAGGWLLDLLEATPALLWAALFSLLVGVVPWGARPRWFLRWLRHYSQITFAGSAIPYNVIAGVIAGFVATYFTYTFLPRPELTEPLILDDVLPALGFSLYRIVIPVLVTLLWAGRTGAALASDFGNRVYHHQTLAMRSLGAPTQVYLGTTALWASLVGVLVVNVVAWFSACLTSLVVFLVVQPEYSGFYWQVNFFRRLEPFHWLIAGQGLSWVLGKLLISAGGVCGIAYWIGTRPKRDTAEVSRGITATVYWGTVFVLLVHFVAAFLEFDKLKPVG